MPNPKDFRLLTSLPHDLLALVCSHLEVKDLHLLYIYADPPIQSALESSVTNFRFNISSIFALRRQLTAKDYPGWLPRFKSIRSFIFKLNIQFSVTDQLVKPIPRIQHLNQLYELSISMPFAAVAFLDPSKVSIPSISNYHDQLDTFTSLSDAFNGHTDPWYPLKEMFPSLQRLTIYNAPTWSKFGIPFGVLPSSTLSLLPHLPPGLSHLDLSFWPGLSIEHLKLLPSNLKHLNIWKPNSRIEWWSPEYDLNAKDPFMYLPQTLTSLDIHPDVKFPVQISSFFPSSLTVLNSTMTTDGLKFLPNNIKELILSFSCIISDEDLLNLPKNLTKLEVKRTNFPQPSYLTNASIGNFPRSLTYLDILMPWIIFRLDHPNDLLALPPNLIHLRIKGFYRFRNLNNKPPNRSTTVTNFQSNALQDVSNAPDVSVLKYLPQNLKFLSLLDFTATQCFYLNDLQKNIVFLELGINILIDENVNLPSRLTNLKLRNSSIKDFAINLLPSSLNELLVNVVIATGKIYSSDPEELRPASLRQSVRMFLRSKPFVSYSKIQTTHVEYIPPSITNIITLKYNSVSPINLPRTLTKIELPYSFEINQIQDLPPALTQINSTACIPLSKWNLLPPNLVKLKYLTILMDPTLEDLKQIIAENPEKFNFRRVFRFPEDILSLSRHKISSNIDYYSCNLEVSARGEYLKLIPDDCDSVELSQNDTHSVKFTDLVANCIPDLISILRIQSSDLSKFMVPKLTRFRDLKTLKFVAWPGDNLKESIGLETIILPSSLTDLVIKNVTPKMFEAIRWPDSLVSLTLTGYNLKASSLKLLPASLKKLCLRSSLCDVPLDGSCIEYLPRFLEELEVDFFVIRDFLSQFPKTLKIVRLPVGMKCPKYNLTSKVLLRHLASQSK